jgi:hypothetical protein
VKRGASQLPICSRDPSVPALHFPVLQSPAIIPLMESIRYIGWQNQGQWLGYLQDYSDYGTQGESFEDLQSHLGDLYRYLLNGRVLLGVQ